MSDVAFFVMRKFLKDNCSLMEHQVDCCRSLISKRRALFVDAVGNGKSLMCLYSYSYLRSRNSVDLMVVFTPLNAYTKEIWLKDAQKFTNLRCLSIDELKEACFVWAVCRGCY